MLESAVVYSRLISYKIKYKSIKSKYTMTDSANFHLVVLFWDPENVTIFQRVLFLRKVCLSTA